MDENVPYSAAGLDGCWGHKVFNCVPPQTMPKLPDTDDLMVITYSPATVTSGLVKGLILYPCDNHL